MGAIRATAVAVLMLFSTVFAAAECVTGTRLLSTSASVPNLVAGPIAWSGNVLAVAKTEEGVPGNAWVGIYGEGMETIEPDRFLVSDARTLYALTWTGSEFGLFYRSFSQSLHLQRMTMLGSPIGAPVVITPGRPVFAGDKVEVRWSPVHDAYVVVRFVSQGNARGLHITMIERDGSQRSDRPVFVAPAQSSPVALAVTDAGFIGVVFSTANDLISMAIVSGSSDTPVVRELTAGGSAEIAVAARNEQFVIVRTALSNEGREVLRWLIADPSHQIVKGDTLLFGTSDADVHPRVLVVTEDELALSYVHSPIPIETLDDTFRLRRISFTGALIGDTAFAPTDLSAARAVTSFPFVWTGTSYVAAPVRASLDRVNSHLVRYCPLRAQILGPRVVLAGDTATFSPAADGGVPGYTYQWKFSHQARVESGVVTVERTFTETGTYTATLTVTDNTGVVTTTTFTFEVVKPRRRGVRK